MRIKMTPLTCVAVPFVAGIVVAAAISFPVISAPAAPDSKVEIDNFAFSPARITVKAGTTVTWVNHDDIPHSIVCPALKMKSHPMDTDETFAYRLEQEGTFDYICGLHPHMHGQVVVAA